MSKNKRTHSPKDESRRDFGRGVAATLAGVTLVPTGLLCAPGALAGDLTELQDQDQGADLSAQARAEIDAKVQNIIARWGDRLSEEQRTRLRATVTRHVRMLETVRAFPLENGDPPAPVLRVLEERAAGVSKSNAAGAPHEAVQPSGQEGN
jgi:hypothetical protein